MACSAAFSQETKERVVFYCRNGENINLVAKYNDVPLSVARQWVLEQAESDEVKRRPQKLSPGMKDFLRYRVEEEPAVSASILVEELASEFEARVSARVVQRYVKGLVCKRSEPEEVGGSAKKMRKNFLADHKLAVEEGSRIVYTDECHFYLRPDDDSDPEPHFLMVAMTREGIVHHSLVRRPMSSRAYLFGWLEELAEKISAQKTTALQSTVVVLDNAPYHGGVEAHLKRCRFKDISVLRLAPTFSDDNPVEKVILEVKRTVRNLRRSCGADMLDCQETYSKILDGIGEALGKVTRSDCERYVDEVLL